MKVKMSSSFTAFDLTKQEELSGYTFHEANKAVIQNKISEYAEDLVSMSLRVVELTQEEILKVEYTRGAIQALQHLLLTGEILTAEADQEVLNSQSNS